MKRKNGFTVLEIVLCIVFVGIFLVLFFIQKNNIEAMERDDDRKVAINAMFYALEEGQYAEKGYYPENCRWTDITTQQNNKENNVRISFDGETHTQAEWSRLTGLNRYLIHDRLERGWSVYRTLTTPPKERNRKR